MPKTCPLDTLTGTRTTARSLCPQCFWPMHCTGNDLAKIQRRKTHPRITPNAPQMHPKRTPNTPPDLPRHTPHHPIISSS